LLFLLLVAGLAGARQPQVDVSRLDRADLQSAVDELLRTYSPTGWDIIDHCRRCPTTLDCGGVTVKINSCPDYTAYVRSRTPNSIIAGLIDVVHEMTHEYQSRIAYAMLAERGIKPRGERYHAYYFGEGTMLVRQTAVYRTAEMQGLFPTELRTVRFPIYIFPASDNGAQIDGIYGLLDEYNAYYLGTKAALDFLPYYRDSRASTPEDWLSFFDNMNRYYFAQVEFRLFILNYLRYAKAHHPDVYAGIMANADFRRAFYTVDAGFTKLVRNYFAAKKPIFAQLRSAGYTVSEDDEYLRIGKNGAYIGHSNFLRAYNTLTAELAKPAYREVMSALGAE